VEVPEEVILQLRPVYLEVQVVEVEPLPQELHIHLVQALNLHSQEIQELMDLEIQEDHQQIQVVVLIIVVVVEVGLELLVQLEQREMQALVV
jgi:hypothetical protein